MMTYSRVGFWQTASIVPLSIFFLTLLAHPGVAQVIPDATLGAEQSQVNAINPLSDRIDGGAIRGGNLFHSFQYFDIGAGRSVYFANPGGIANIFSRVTGNLPSNINGTLGVLGTGNLFFINPNGIVFGKNAALDIKGSFTASTAHSLVFANSERFSTINPSVPALLTVDVQAPIGIQFEGGPPIGDITSTGKLSAGQDLVLSGGTLNLAQQGSLSAGQTIKLNAQRDILLGTAEQVDIETPKITLKAGGSVKIGDISNQSMMPLAIDIQSTGNITFINRIISNGGSISANSSNGNITVNEGELNTRFPAKPASLSDRSGDISLIAKGDINIGDPLDVLPNEDRFTNLNSQGGTIKLMSIQGNITTTTTKRNGFLQINSVGKQGGEVTIAAPNGNIQTGNIQTGALASSATAENGGPISLTAKSDISTGFLESVSSVTYQGGSNAYTKNGGNISINSDQGNIATGFIKTGSYFNSSSLAAPTPEIGNGGKIELNAGQGNITVEATQLQDGFYNSGIESYAYSSVPSASLSSKAGEIKINAPNGQFSLLYDSQFKALPRILAFSSDGIGGSVNITTRDDVTLPLIITTAKNGSGNIAISTSKAGSTVTMSQFFISTDTFGSGRGGDITISAPSIQLLNGGQFSASTHANGRGGDITIQATEKINIVGGSPDVKLSGELLFNDAGVAGIPIAPGTFLGGYLPTGNLKQQDFPAGTLFPSGIFTQTTIGSTGDAGNIAITSPQVTIQDRAKIAATTFGAGRSGTITINSANGSILLDQQASISTGSAIESSGASREIKLQTRSLKLLGGSAINTETVSDSDAGDIAIDANFVLLRNQSRIFTNAGLANQAGNGGNILVNANGGFIVAGPSENSDIAANAFSGGGGKVEITARAIYGLVSRSRADLEILLGTSDPEKLNPKNIRTSDITAISQQNPLLNGQVILNANINPTQGVNQIPLEPRATNIADSCQVSNGKEAVQFFDIGRGGLPPRPEDPLSMDLIEWVPAFIPKASIPPFQPGIMSEFSPAGVPLPDRPSPSFQASTATLKLLPPCQSH